LEVLEENVPLLTLLTPIPNDNARAIDDLSGISFTIQCTKPSPFSQLLPIGNFNQGDLVFGAQSLDELLVRLLLATLVEHGHVGLATIQRLARLAEAAGEAVVDKRMPEDSLECFLDGHLALGGAIGRDRRRVRRGGLLLLRQT